ncbi:ATP-binding protein [Streptomyces sp. NPDC007162]|uniref:ATP-binding protein n=1 Tax=Streptomyces sp. NPDC007162 TaxID=3156917 RepID=UPI0033CA5E48
MSSAPGQPARVFGNLLDNAQRHTATAITVTLARAGDDVVLTVADDGHGGDLTVTGAPGGGAAFLVTLPRAPLDVGGDRD